MGKKADDISEAAYRMVAQYIDKATLAAKLDLAETAAIYRDVGTECRDRAAGLVYEAEQSGQ